MPAPRGSGRRAEALVSAGVLLLGLFASVVASRLPEAGGYARIGPNFVPKLVAIFVTLVLAGPWMITLLTDFIRRLFESIPAMIG